MTDSSNQRRMQTTQGSARRGRLKQARAVVVADAYEASGERLVGFIGALCIGSFADFVGSGAQRFHPVFWHLALEQYGWAACSLV